MDDNNTVESGVNIVDPCLRVVNAFYLGVNNYCTCKEVSMSVPLNIKKNTRYGKLVIKQEVIPRTSRRYFVCDCDCGNTTTVALQCLRSGDTTSCGCLQGNRKSSVSTASGDRFTRWVVIKEVSPEVHFDGTRNQKVRRIECKCDCGKISIVLLGHLRSGKSTSCGCLGLEKTIATCTTHGLSKHYLYGTWKMMMARCYKTNNKAYHYYGG